MPNFVVHAETEREGRFRRPSAPTSPHFGEVLVYFLALPIALSYHAAVTVLKIVGRSRT